jgi:hypothetical protein
MADAKVGCNVIELSGPGRRARHKIAIDVNASVVPAAAQDDRDVLPRIFANRARSRGYGGVVLCRGCRVDADHLEADNAPLRDIEEPAPAAVVIAQADDAFPFQFAGMNPRGDGKIAFAHVVSIVRGNRFAGHDKTIARD